MALIPYSTLERLVKSAGEKVKVGSIYYHWKNPEASAKQKENMIQYPNES